MDLQPISRRGVLTAVSGAGLSLLPGLALAGAGLPGEQRFVVVILRGAMDGLSAVPAHGDPDYAAARTGLAIAKPGQTGGALPLDSVFGLNPALEGLAKRWTDGELLVFHAIASPYRDRSHFDAQNLLENGSGKPYGLADGWLNRALPGLPGAAKAGRPQLGVALAPAMPLMLRGATPVTSWSPSVLPGPSADLVARLAALYGQTDPDLAKALVGAGEAQAATSGMDHGEHGGALCGLMTAAAGFLIKADGPRVAVIESTGWDTHANQVGPYAVLGRNLRALDQGIDTLARGLGAVWSRTAVVVVTEFGRTVAMNGTAGSDHGTASAAFLVGGAVKGGRVIADWPGLKPASLYAGRDLAPTSDLRALMKAVLRDHMGIEREWIDSHVFPDSVGVKPFEGLFRA